jgi:hypothetical protein
MWEHVCIVGNTTNAFFQWELQTSVVYMRDWCRSFGWQMIAQCQSRTVLGLHHGRICYLAIHNVWLCGNQRHKSSSVGVFKGTTVHDPHYSQCVCVLTCMPLYSGLEMQVKLMHSMCCTGIHVHVTYSIFKIVLIDNYCKCVFKVEWMDELWAGSNIEDCTGYCNRFWCKLLSPQFSKTIDIM